jgi:hypothetical protein
MLLSLSRFNHRLPRSQPYPEVVQGTAEIHDQIADTLLPQAHPVFHDATALDTAVAMLDPQPTLGERLVRLLLLPREILTAGLLGRPADRHLREREGPLHIFLAQRSNNCLPLRPVCLGGGSYGEEMRDV